MADSTEKKIFQALATAANAVTLPAGWSMVLPGVSFTPTATSRFVSAEVHFNRPIGTDAVSQQMQPIRQGFMRMNVMLPKGAAVVDGFDLAGKLCDAFAIGRKLYKDTVQVRIDEHPEIGPLMTGETHHTIPTTVRWHSYPQVSA
jgi:hypothetical protein